MRVITYQEIEELPGRLIAFLERIRDSRELTDTDYDEMFETMKLYRNFQVRTGEMLPDRAIDFSTGIERVAEVMSRKPNFDEAKWNHARQESNTVWHEGNIEIEESLHGVSSLPFYNGHYVYSVFDDPGFFGIVVHEVIPSRR
jgi:hypothetical protein